MKLPRSCTEPPLVCRGYVWLLLGMCALSLTSCQQAVPAGTLVLTQTPVEPPQGSAAPRELTPDLLDARYPTGSRVVGVELGSARRVVHLLSRGLCAAGEPVIAADGQTVFFSGKRRPGDRWQIFRVRTAGGYPAQVTTMPGGAMNPAVLAGGTLVFSSPVPKGAPPWNTGAVPALYTQAGTKPPERLTFGISPALEPTPLHDGRILFISTRGDAKGSCNFGLYTINNDGSEVTAFALDHDGQPFVRRPRELPNGHVAFLSSSFEQPSGSSRGEIVRTARPFSSRATIASLGPASCSSIEAAGPDSVLACTQTEPSSARAVYQIDLPRRQRAEGGRMSAVFADSSWHILEAAAVGARPAPMGHISTLTLGEKTGTILCLNAGFTRGVERGSPGDAKPVRVRVLARSTGNQCESLGEIPLQPDGSFMAEVPADTPLGFETLGADGHVLHRLSPSIWVRPGENRSCVGCHEPPNRSPQNIRPLAVTLPPAVLTNRLESSFSAAHESTHAF